MVEKEQFNLTSTGLIINGAVWFKAYILSQISHRQSHFESLKQYYSGKPYICLGVQSHPEDQGDFEQGSTLNISESNNQLELSTYNMCCSYMVLTNPHMKHWIQFIIMKIFMNRVKFCPKSPRFTVFKGMKKIYIKEFWEPGYFAQSRILYVEYVLENPIKEIQISAGNQRPVLFGKYENMNFLEMGFKILKRVPGGS